MVQIPYQGRMVEAEEVEVIAEKECWNEYQLADGSALRVKTTLIRVHKAQTEKSPDGTPLYLTRTTQVVDVKI